MTRAYCTVCEWTCTVDETGSRHALNRAIIDHYGETNHGPIVTSDAPDAEPEFDSLGVDPDPEADADASDPAVDGECDAEELGGD